MKGEYLNVIVEDSGAGTVEEIQIRIFQLIVKYAKDNSLKPPASPSDISFDDEDRKNLKLLNERLDSELVYLAGAEAAIDQMNAGQVRDVVKRLVQEMQLLLKVQRYVIRRQ